MKLEGLHHVTMMQLNVAFYADVLGLRLVKKTVNFDRPDALIASDVDARSARVGA